MGEAEVVIATLGVLTSREAEAVLWIAQGKASWEAGRILGVSEHTLSTHAANAAEKLSASNRAHLVARAFVAGVLAVSKNGAAAVILIACTLGFHDGRRPPRPPRRRQDESAQVVAAGEA